MLQWPSAPFHRETHPHRNTAAQKLMKNRLARVAAPAKMRAFGHD
jgi:hypothetical protein